MVIKVQSENMNYSWTWQARFQHGKSDIYLNWAQNGKVLHTARIFVPLLRREFRSWSFTWAAPSPLHHDRQGTDHSTASLRVFALWICFLFISVFKWSTLTDFQSLFLEMQLFDQQWEIFTQESCSEKRRRKINIHYFFYLSMLPTLEMFCPVEDIKINNS